jgi:hypothetical protein
MKLLAIILATVTTAATIVLAQPAPDVVMLDELVAVYEPVPFDHKTHAAMAEMWQGCETCHHRTPTVATAAASQPAGLVSRAKTQANAANMPACKECHDVANQRADIRMPNLKGAYHRQCLNCHREWANENGCSACHREQKKSKAHDARDPSPPPPPTVDDIVGRMHPPIPEPETHVYQARFTPAVGSSVLFRHKEHTVRYGLKCSSCHHRDNCSDCHDATAKTIAQKPLRPGRTWKDSHGPCLSCHQQDRCGHCHYDKSATPPPPTFDHRVTGQLLDTDHRDLRCGQCHGQLKSKVKLSCGGAECHQRTGIAFPADRPGAIVTTRPVQLASAPPTSTAASTQPATRPIIRRIRRGGS